ncbi:MAG: NTP transferase domain-containing protein [Candidatus Andersenbacteria bacterium]
MQYKVLIPTSGTGSRLGELTAAQNKALVPINGKPALAYIIEAYPRSVPLVVTLGYRAQEVKPWLMEAYPSREIEFVLVDKYEGPGTSLGYSMLQARSQLQCPFIFQACDTLLTESIPEPDMNWVGGYTMPPELKTVAAQHYRTQSCNDEGRLLSINPIGTADFNYIHIGITGVHDFEAWWDALSMLYSKNPTDSTLTDTHVITAMLEQQHTFAVVPYAKWYDTGNPEALAETRAYFERV